MKAVSALFTRQWVIAGVLLLLSVPPAFGQLDNSCTYRYSWGTTADYSYFSFCLTKYGTLASLEIAGPTGEMLDPSNPVEGWYLSDDENRYPKYYVAPGLGQGVLPTVSEPKGSGNLPIIFSWYKVKETVTAIPSEKSVVFTMGTDRQVGTGADKGEWSWGPVVRFAQLMVNGYTNNSFDNTYGAAFGYSTQNGVLLTGVEMFHQYPGYPLITYPAGGWVSQQGVDGVNAFVGQGTVESDGWFSTAGPAKNVFTYKIF